MHKAVLYGVGVGPGDPGLLTLRAVETIRRCPVLAAPQTENGATLALDIVRGAVDIGDKEILYLRFAMSRDEQVLAKSHAEAAGQVVSQLALGRDVAMLNLGDVSIYATFHHLKPLVEAAGYTAVMVPGVPSFCAVAAALGENLTPQMYTPLHILPAGCPDLPAALAQPGTKVVMKAGKPLAGVKSSLREAGLYEKASLVQNCGLPDQRVAHTLDEAEENGGYFTTLVVRP